MFNSFNNQEVSNNEASDFVYLAYGKTLAGRYLFTVFIYKRQNTGLIISARDMTLKERRYYNAQKKS